MIPSLLTASVLGSRIILRVATLAPIGSRSRSRSTCTLLLALLVSMVLAGRRWRSRRVLPFVFAMALALRCWRGIVLRARILGSRRICVCAFLLTLLVSMLLTRRRWRSRCILLFIFAMAATLRCWRGIRCAVLRARRVVPLGSRSRCRRIGRCIFSLLLTVLVVMVLVRRRGSHRRRRRRRVLPFVFTMAMTLRCRRGIKSIDRNRGHGRAFRLALFNRTIDKDILENGGGDGLRCLVPSNGYRDRTVAAVIFTLGAPSPMRINRDFP